MAFIELPQTPNTGLAQFGSALSSGAHDYMENQFANQRLAQQQQNQFMLEQYGQQNRIQLAGVDAQNRLQQGSADTQNRIQLMNATNAADIRKGAIELLVTHGYLTSIDDANDPVKFHQALLASQRDGLYQRYQALMSTPDPATGKPLLSPSEMTDPLKVNAAMDKMATYQAGQTGIGLQGARNAKDAATAAQLQLQQIQQQKQDLNQRVQALQAQAQPTDKEIDAQALIIASQGLKPPEVPSDAAKAAARPQAMQEIMATKLQQIAALRAPIDEQRRNLDASENRITQQLNEFSKKNVYPDSSQLTDPTDDSAAPAASAPALDPRVVGNAALGALVRPAAAPAAQPGMLADPTGSDPIIAAENQRRQGLAFQNNVTTPLQQAQQEAASIDQQLQTARAPQHQPSYSPYAPFQVVGQGPGQQAQQISTLLQRKAAVQARISQLQSLATQQPTANGVTPMLSDPTLNTGLGMPQTGAATATPSLSDFNESTPFTVPTASASPDLMSLYGSPSFGG